jgi:hypothetical protein
LLAIKVFLSHKYEAPCVNEYFFRLFSTANVQFEVDKTKLSTNVTRLERMIRGADGFLAIYPLDDDGDFLATEAEFLERSQYFRLELELAARSAKPGLVLIDQRFRGIIDVPGGMCTEQFDVREIAGSGEKPSSGRFQLVFESFCKRVRAATLYELEVGAPARGSRSVGLLLPKGPQHAYGPAEIDAISEALEKARYEPVPLRWPAAVTPVFISKLRSFNYVVADIGPESMASGIPGFVHGLFVPTMRLMRVGSEAEAEPRLMPESSLYGAVEIGYWKDIARWWDHASLQNALTKRLATLDAPTRRFATLDAAIAYFQETAKRKERVFISYTRSDEAETLPLRDAFRKRFEVVFDYRDGKSIRAGRSWSQEIANSIAQSAVCVPLLSSGYVNSDNCIHELDDAVAARDNKKAQVFPIRVRENDDFVIPPNISYLEYLWLHKFKNADRLVNEIVALLQAAEAESAAKNAPAG